MIKFFKILGILLLSAIIIAAAAYFTFLSVTKDAILDEEKLLSVGQNITVTDRNGEEIAQTSLTNSRKTVKLAELKDYTKNAFIASEDRNFYSHRGLNYKRMLKAAYKNVISRSFKEGASTISQQLVKNTHLSGDKTISRKLKEIRLAKKLEKKYSKDEILEMYVNTIYFGHNCYGIESAANFYFDKKASDLDLGESAVLVGLLTSPNNYSPFKNPEKCLKRRDAVLKAMLDCKFIDESQYKNALDLPLTAKRHEDGENFSDYLHAVFDELEEIEDIDFYNLGEDCKIITNLDCDLQAFCEQADYPCDNSVIITDNSGGVLAYKSTIGGAKRQPGSAIKPLAVYAPAIEEKLISPYTRILDEKINYNGYSPANADNKFHGYVTVEDSLKLSYNIPAVKTLNSLTPEKSEKYLSLMNIELDDGDKNLSLALGGMKHGVTIKQLADGYSQFANKGVFKKSKFIKKILSKDGKTIYEAENLPVRAFSEGTCSLINGMLLKTSESGTAKKLKTLDFDVASKTGTCGNAEGNTDAYCACYTSRHTVCVWLGDKDYKKTDVTGGKESCEIAKAILENLYKDEKPQNIETSAGTTEIELDAEEYYDNNKIVLADKLSPKLNVVKVRTLSGNIPLECSTKFSSPKISKPDIEVKNNAVNIILCHTKYYSYLIYRNKNGQNELIYDGKWKEVITDEPPDGKYVYTVIPYFTSGNYTAKGKSETLPAVNIGASDESPQVKIPDIVNKDWYDL